MLLFQTRTFYFSPKKEQGFNVAWERFEIVMFK